MILTSTGSQNGVLYNCKPPVFLIELWSNLPQNGICDHDTSILNIVIVAKFWVLPPPIHVLLSEASKGFVYLSHNCYPTLDEWGAVSTQVITILITDNDTDNKKNDSKKRM